MFEVRFLRQLIEPHRGPVMANRKLFAAIAVLCIPILVTTSAAMPRVAPSRTIVPSVSAEPAAPLRESASPIMLLAMLGMGSIVVGRRVSSRW